MTTFLDYLYISHVLITTVLAIVHIHFVTNDNLKCVIASCDIPKNTEITFSYILYQTKTRNRRQELLRKGWNFQCTCKTCRNDERNSKLENVAQLDEDIEKATLANWIEPAFYVACDLLGLYEELQLPLQLFSRTYYDIYNIALLQGNLPLAQTSVNRALEYAMRYYGTDQHTLVQKYKKILTKLNKYDDTTIQDDE